MWGKWLLERKNGPFSVNGEAYLHLKCIYITINALPEKSVPNFFMHFRNVVSWLCNNNNSFLSQKSLFMLIWYFIMAKILFVLNMKLPYFLVNNITQPSGSMIFFLYLLVSKTLNSHCLAQTDMTSLSTYRLKPSSQITRMCVLQKWCMCMPHLF